LGFLDRLGLHINRKALHVDRISCNNCDMIFDDKYYKKEYSDNDASGKASIGDHLVICPYCGHINTKTTAHVHDIVWQGRFRDHAEELYYDTKYGQLPPDPRFNTLIPDHRHPEKVKFRDLNEIKCEPRKVA
jgi:hypothetical protein